jgi:hypothetical protein
MHLWVSRKVITLAAAVSVTDRPAAAPQTGPFNIEIEIIGHPSFVDAINAVSTIICKQPRSSSSSISLILTFAPCAQSRSQEVCYYVPAISLCLDRRLILFTSSQLLQHCRRDARSGRLH